MGPNTRPCKYVTRNFFFLLGTIEIDKHKKQQKKQQKKMPKKRSRDVTGSLLTLGRLSKHLSDDLYRERIKKHMHYHFQTRERQEYEVRGPRLLSAIAVAANEMGLEITHDQFRVVVASGVDLIGDQVAEVSLSNEDEPQCILNKTFLI
jgi:hypothetical protein